MQIIKLKVSTMATFTFKWVLKCIVIVTVVLLECLQMQPRTITRSRYSASLKHDSRSTNSVLDKQTRCTVKEESNRLQW